MLIRVRMSEVLSCEAVKSGKVALCEKNSKKIAKNKAQKNKRRYYTAKEFVSYDFAHRGDVFFL